MIIGLGEFKLKKEREVIGFYLSDHPTKNIKRFILTKILKIYQL